MPRKLIRRWMPDPKKITNVKALAWLQPLLSDPNLFHLNRQSVSLAFFVGLSCAFIPLPVQTGAVALLALLLRCNLPIAMVLMWVSNPLTFAPMFYMAFELGQWILGSEPVQFELQVSWSWFQSQGGHILLPLLLGCFVAGITSGSLGYLVIRYLWRWHVVRSWEERKLRRQRAKQQP